MAGETPRAGKVRNKRIAWRDDRSTDKYYASGDQSVIRGGQAAAANGRKPGQLPQPLNARLPRKNDRGTDKYYASALPPPPALGQIQRGDALRRPSRPVQSPVGQIRSTINDAAEINPSMDALVDVLHQGSENIVLYVKTGDSQLLRQTRTALETLVTRERITEEMYRAVRLSYTPSTTDKAALDVELGVPQPAGVRDIDAEEADSNAVDPEAFLRGDVKFNDGEDLDSAADKTTIHVVDTTNDVQDSPAPSYPSAPEVDDDDDSDFSINSLKAANAAEVAISQPQETPEDAGLSAGIEIPSAAMPGIGDAPKPKKPGRRGGRGA